MKIIKTLAELEKAIELAARKTMEEASKDILHIFKEDYIEKMVYKVDPKVYYNPRGHEFKNAWQWTDIRSVANTLEMVMMGEYGGMSMDEEKYIHASYSPWGLDSRFFLEKVLNKDGRSSSNPMSRTDGEAYWDNFIKDMLGSGKLKKIIDKHAMRNGFNPSGMGIR